MLLKFSLFLSDYLLFQGVVNVIPHTWKLSLNNGDYGNHIGRQCAKQRMPKKSQCSSVKGRRSVCGHRRIEHRKPISPVWLGVIVAVGIIVVVVAIILAALCWYRRFCRQVTIVVEESSSLLTSPEQKGRDCQ